MAGNREPGTMHARCASMLGAPEMDQSISNVLWSITNHLDPSRTGKVGVTDLQKQMELAGLDFNSQSVNAFGSMCVTSGQTVDYSVFIEYMATHSKEGAPSPHRQLRLRRADGTRYHCPIPALIPAGERARGKKKFEEQEHAAGVDSVVFGFREVGGVSPTGGDKTQTVRKVYSEWESGKYGKTQMLRKLAANNVYCTQKANQLCESGSGITFKSFLKALDTGPNSHDTDPTVGRSRWGSYAAGNTLPRAPEKCVLVEEVAEPKLSLTSKRSRARALATSFVGGTISSGVFRQGLQALGVAVVPNGGLDRMIHHTSVAGGYGVRDFTKAINALCLEERHESPSDGTNLPHHMRSGSWHRSRLNRV